MQKSIKFKRVYHPACKWEEIDSNMWGTVECATQFLRMAIEFTGNDELYGSFMLRVIDEWPVSCENALTDYRLNRKAWIGAAACALAFQCPEDVVRKAWGYLTDEQRKLANRRAAYAIGKWEERAKSRLQLCGDVGGEMLSLWDTGLSATEA